MIKPEIENFLYETFENSKEIKSCLNKFQLGYLDTITGMSSTNKAFFVNYLKKKTKRPILLVTSSLTKTLNFQNKLNLIEENSAEYFFAQETSPYQLVFNDAKIYSEELKTLRNFKDKTSKLLLMDAKSLLNIYPDNNFFKKYSLKFKPKKEFNLVNLAMNLIQLGYRRETMVSDVGEFSLRGDILDIYPINDNPLRIEFWGDDVENIRYFDIKTQRTVSKATEATIEPRYKLVIDDKQKFSNNLEKNYQAQLKTIGPKFKNSLEFWCDSLKEDFENQIYFEGIEYFSSYVNSNFSTVFDFLPEDTIIIFDESHEVLQKCKNQHLKYIEEYQTLCYEGLATPLEHLNHLKFEKLTENLKGVKTLKLDSFLDSNDEFQMAIHSSLLPKFNLASFELTDFITPLLEDNYQILAVSQYPQRIEELLKEQDIPVNLVKNKFNNSAVNIIKSEITEGFISSDLNLAFITDVEFFNKKLKKPTITKKLSKKEDLDYIYSLNDLTEGDFVVHLTHGIGKYLGISKQEIDNQSKDYLTIEYANADKLHIPAEQINLLARYRGSQTTPPKLSKMGGEDWGKTKSKVKKAVNDIAKDLIRLYAKRAKKEGFSFDSDTPWQVEMEDAFPFVETPDQLKAITATKNDMETPNPMDRLICGDVGFGKTEVAIRAIFKAIVSGKQCAMLVPTTILAQQHYQSIKERFAPFPVSVELMSRFKTPKEQKEIVKKLTMGECDLVVGTHRLLQKDILFKDLGLVVIDEEHRFGVAHKEKLKHMRAEVDVLSLSATPIPRTLYMSLSGVRDMSLITTPPVNRLPIKTFVGQYNDDFIKTAINYELEREGQVYFLYNRVQSIKQFALHIQQLVPSARIGIGHGQMNPKELEQVMYDFSVNNYDVLICTTIIESGLDIPNANTMLIYDADKFGLAQLYQIRGRIGRSERQAYAYCFYRQDKILTDEATDRLKAIKDFTTLGSGYQIALRDLEIRGVGNLLGAQQHGHMISVGFDVYCNLLEEEIKELQGEPVDRKEAPIMDINITAFIPDDWVGDKQQKMIEYKRLADVKSISELELLRSEWEDRFGKIPETVEPLIKIIKLRLIAGDIGVNLVRETPDNIRIYTNYKQNEWIILSKDLPNNIGKRLKFTKAPQNLDRTESIILFRHYALTCEEVLDLLECLFYYIFELQKTIIKK